MEINDTKLSCDGYQFKGWEIVTKNVKKITKNYFVMPEENVILRAKWSKMTVKKKMEGEIHKAQKLYQMIAQKAVPDNVASEFVSSNTGIRFDLSPSDTNGKGVYQLASTKDDEYPVYYYRGAVEDNNATFGGFCWKIVRTTDTGGVKLLYNGVLDSNGECNNTGEASQIGKNSYVYYEHAGTYYAKDFSIADVGYMQGSRYFTKSKGLSFLDLSGKEKQNEWIFDYYGTTNYYYGDGVTYSNGKYTLKNARRINTEDESLSSRDFKKLYTCFSETTTCETVKYIFSGYGSSYVNYIEMTGGETFDTIVTKLGKMVYGKDVTYSNGKYTLVDTIAVSLADYDNYSVRNSLGYRHYTCFSTSNTCSTVNYMFNTYIDPDDLDSAGTAYITLSNGEKLEDAKNNMFLNNKESLIKTNIDDWYSKNLKSYTNYLEDTIWCNDRSFVSGALKSSDTYYLDSYWGWNTSEFGAWNTNNNSITTICPNKNDSFTVSTERGNGKLTYPIALITGEEFKMAGYNKTSYLFTGESWYTLSPYEFDNHPKMLVADKYGSMKKGTSFEVSGVRPSISLRSDIKVESGNGSTINPYVIEINDIKTYDIKISDNDDIKSSLLKSPKGAHIMLKSKSGNHEVISFKMNEKLIEGDSFVIPDEDVVITDINTVYIIESNHYDYCFGNSRNKVYDEKNFEGASSLVITLDYQTSNEEKLYFYDSTGKAYGAYYGTDRKKVTMTIPGNYLKFVVDSYNSYCPSYYGFKVTVVPNYN